MQIEPISPALRRFILDSFASINQLEVFLLLVRSEGKAWSPLEVERALRTGTHWTQKTLNELKDLHLIYAGALPDTYQFENRGDEASQMALELVSCYRNYRLRVTDLIFSRREDVLRDFSEAFRLAKREPGADR